MLLPLGQGLRGPGVGAGLRPARPKGLTASPDRNSTSNLNSAPFAYLPRPAFLPVGVPTNTGPTNRVGGMGGW